MRDVTFICAYFDNQGILKEQQTIWSSYGKKLRAHFHVIVTDDCSTRAPALEVFHSAGLASQRLFRAEVHRRWDWLFPRNLGAEMATTDWIVLTDIDHAMPGETLRNILRADLDPTVAYRFSRVTAPRPYPYALSECSPYKRHNDSWLMTRQLFFDVGGYDERLSGCYGSSSDFTGRVVTAIDFRDVLLNDVLIRYPREVIADASTPPSVYTRKGDGENDRELQRRKAERAQIKGWRPLRLTIPYVLEASL